MIDKEKLINIDGKFYTPEIAEQIKQAQHQVEHYDLLQLTRKIQLNSFYGSLLSKGFRWGLEEKVGASVTYTGRAITTNMANTAAFLLTGEDAGLVKSYNLDKKVIQNIYHSSNPCIIYSDTDSVAFNSVIQSNYGHKTIEDLFLLADRVEYNKNNECAFFNNLDSLTYNPLIDKNEFKKVKLIYRHKVNKSKWKITTSSGKQIIITDDHSIMIERNGILQEIKASEINLHTDMCICVK